MTYRATIFVFILTWSVFAASKGFDFVTCRASVVEPHDYTFGELEESDSKLQASFWGHDFTVKSESGSRFKMAIFKSGRLLGEKAVALTEDGTQQSLEVESGIGTASVWCWKGGAGPLHFISTACSDGATPKSGFQLGYLAIATDGIGELYFSESSHDDQYSCQTSVKVRFEDRFNHPIGRIPCGYFSFEIDLPEMNKVSEKTISISPTLKMYDYESSAFNSIGFCNKGSKLLMRIEPL